MKIFVPLMSTLMLLMLACTSPSQNEMDAQTSMMLSSVFNYQCKSGETISATYPSTDSATIQYKGHNYIMQIAVSASGSRYVGGGLEWWSKGHGPGSDGTLSQQMADGTSGEGIEFCTAL